MFKTVFRVPMFDTAAKVQNIMYQIRIICEKLFESCYYDRV